MAQLLNKHMAVNSPVYPHQWGFCKGKSTAGALALAVDQWHRHLEKVMIYVLCSLIILLLTLSHGSMTDNIMIYRPIHTPEDLVMLQSDIDSLACWTDQSFLQFNADKCKYMVISRKRQINLSMESQPPLQINGVAMERVDDYKYLGVWITSNLSWSKHISEVCHKARQRGASSITSVTEAPTMPLC